MICRKVKFFPIWRAICWIESVLIWTCIKEMKRRWQLTEDNVDKSENKKLSDNQKREVFRNNSSIELRARQSSHKLKRIKSATQSNHVKVKWTLVNQRMMMGRKKLKTPEMDAGNTPDTMANEDGEDWNQLWRKGIYALIYKMWMSLRMIRYQDEAIVETNRIQIGQNRYKEKGSCIKKTNKTQPNESK